MKKLIWILLGALAWVSCEKEDDLIPSKQRDDYFSVSASDTVNNPEAALRYHFYEKNKMHLLFNDTLRHENRGTYNDGTPYWFTEVIDLGYSIESEGADFQFEYLTDLDEQKKGVEFAEKYILPHLSGKMRPYSLLLLKNLEEYDDYEEEFVESYAYTGMRCMALNVGSVLELEDEEDIAECSADIFYNMVSAKIKSWDKEAMEDFYFFCDEYYYEDYDVFFDSSKKPEIEILWEYGFLDGKKKWFYKKSEDLDSYLKALFYWEEDETIEEYYAGYDIVLKKFSILKNLIESNGYKF